MTKPQIPGTPADMKDCTDPWHSTLSIRQEECPMCRGTAKRDDGGGLELAVAAEAALDILDAVSRASDDADDDD